MASTTQTPYDLLKGLMSDNKVETLVKTRHYGLLSYYLYRSQYRRDSWQLIRICLRHGYKVEDVAIWADHISTLERLGMDIHNPLYLCPKNLRSEHNRLVKLQKQRDDKARKNAEIQRQIQQRKDDEAKRPIRKGCHDTLTSCFLTDLLRLACCRQPKISTTRAR